MAIVLNRLKATEWQRFDMICDKVMGQLFRLSIEPYTDVDVIWSVVVCISFHR